jgi:hypothetical protein
LISYLDLPMDRMLPIEVSNEMIVQNKELNKPVTSHNKLS